MPRLKKCLDQEGVMTEFTSPRPLLQGQTLVHGLNHRVNNEFATARTYEFDVPNRSDLT
jgi:hypothetical protein